MGWVASEASHLNVAEHREICSGGDRCCLRFLMPQPTPATASLVAYEVWMMRETFQLLVSMVKAQEPDETTNEDRELWLVEKNAFLESFLTHYRNVTDFLSPRGSVKETDVTAGPFLGKALRHKIPGTPIAEREAIDTYLSHISTRRTRARKEWLLGQMFMDIEIALTAFAEELEPEVLDWFNLAQSTDMAPLWTSLELGS